MLLLFLIKKSIRENAKLLIAKGIPIFMSLLQFTKKDKENVVKKMFGDITTLRRMNSISHTN